MKYPEVICDEHPGQVESGYMICVHLNSIEDIFYRFKATETEIGVLCCQNCYDMKEDSEYTLENFHLSCAPGLRERGWLVEYEN